MIARSHPTPLISSYLSSVHIPCAVYAAFSLQRGLRPDVLWSCVLCPVGAGYSVITHPVAVSGLVRVAATVKVTDMDDSNVPWF